MPSSTQTILGFGGAIGVAIAESLRSYTDKIRLVSRHPPAVASDDEWVCADLIKPEEASTAVAGSDIVYLTAGLPYRTKVWRKTWPILMKNVIGACKTHRSKLVFFDNVYMYDPACLSFMTEETPVRPGSRKGGVRANIAKMLFDEVEKGNLEALIARSADFYGPGIRNNSLLTETVFKNLAGGRKANWLGSADFKHSFTYTPDAGKATALLGNTPDAYHQVWHLPTAENPFTGKTWIETIAEAMGADPEFHVIPRFLVRALGVFIPIMREMVEMMYQYDRDYVFDSGKFDRRFDFRATPYSAGINEIVANDYADRPAVKKAKTGG